MINIIDKHNCCGCGACEQKCPKQCITLLPDEEGFLYPKVDEDKCIDCGLCEKSCPIININYPQKILRSYAVINPDDVVRANSSSGGVFSVIADKVISEGGVVFGARFNKNWEVEIDVAETKEDLNQFRGSKYVQAKVGVCYQRCKEYLDTGRLVLFTGTPCQISGLVSFLKKPYDNLLTCDIICHGVPSPLVWSIYLEEVLHGLREFISGISFRRKDNGWKHFGFYLDCNKQGESFVLSSPASSNPYMKAFLANISLRPSCYSCPFKEGRSHSDITLADFWGVWDTCPKMFDDKGTSLVLINTDKGLRFFPFTLVRYLETDAEQAIKNNAAYKYSVNPHPKRDYFFNSLSNGGNLHKTIAYCTRPSFYNRLKALIKQSIKKYRWGG